MHGSQKPRVLFLNHWARDLGGAEHSLLDILGLVPVGIDVHLCTTEKGKLQNEARRLGVTCHVVPCHSSLSSIRRGSLLKNLLTSWQKVGAFLLYVGRLRRLVKELQPDCIHANVPKSHMAACLLVVLGYKGRIVLHIREIFEFVSTASALYQMLFPSGNATVIAISRAVRASLPRPLEAKSKVIYNGINLKGLPHRTEECPTAPLRLVYLGRIVPWKGCMDLVRIMSNLRKFKNGKDISLDLIGGTYYWPESYRNELRKEIAIRDLEETCRLVDHTDKPFETLVQYDVYVNASDREPFGRGIVEAQACGLPVISYDSGGIREVMEDNQTGFLVPFKNRKIFAEKIMELHSKKSLLGQFGRNGIELARARFNRENQIPIIWNHILG